METEKLLFNLVDWIGEKLLGNIHIIDITDSDENVAKKYRIYHGDGYCITVSKKEVENEDEEEHIEGYVYDFYSDLFQGFKSINIFQAYNLIEKYK